MNSREVTQEDASFVDSPPESNSPPAISEYAEPKSGQFQSLNTIWLPWYVALKKVFPIYLAIHIAFFVITVVAVLFSGPTTPLKGLPLSTLWNSWKRWDTTHYLRIASTGYIHRPTDTAFFPFYPILIKIGTFIIHNTLVSGLIVSDIACLIMLVVFYKLIEEDFGKEAAGRAVLYISIFPAAFFFAAAYTESVFLGLILIGFYSLRHGQWWIAGLCGLLACFTRSTGILFTLPFLYEYFQQRHFNWRAIRLNILALGLIPAGMGIFAIYCYKTFHNPLLFLQVEAGWRRFLRPPWHGILVAIQSMRSSKYILSFLFLRNLLDLIPILFVLIIIVLCFVGPWRFSRAQWSYGIFAIAVFLFSISFPIDHFAFPLASTTRYLLTGFPIFIILARIGRNRTANLLYVSISGALLFFFLAQFVNNYWIT